MTTEVHAGNLYRKVRALVMKTVANGCTVGEAVSAANTASKLINDAKLNTEKVEWPAAPEGYAWRGKPGRDGRIEAIIGHAKTAPAESPKPAEKPAAAPKPAASPKPTPTEGEKAVKRRQAAATGGAAKAAKAKASAKAEVPKGEFRPGSKAATVLAMLRSKEGTTIEAIMDFLGSDKPHTARAMVSTHGKHVGKKATYNKETKTYRIET